MVIPVGGFTRTPPANDTSYVTIVAVHQHPFSRGSVVRLNQNIFEPNLTS